MTSKPLSKPFETFEEIIAQEKALTLPHFNADDAFALGILIRNRLRELSTSPAVVNIVLGNNQQLLFHAASRPGTVPENDNWIRRKRNVVLRFGFSTWAAHNMFDKGDEDKFKARFQLGEQAGEYAIHGGGFPVRVHAVEGPIAAIVVSGLAQEEDHQVVVECLQILLDEQKQH
ncbi:hypothetical protein IFR04_015911 [Cadophora malorum]|uniref:Uncharacterized protein n=1 Tax=Cadophora malorum TaxID=108018 RepID=A0A8H7VZ08_9HELO|nr:hypothetical protein IFR04_015911 [Cadophora malorum]